MATVDSILESLKSMLRLRGHTYASLAREVGLSESSVKRLFSEKTFTLHRVLEFCSVLNIDFSELVTLAGDSAGVSGAHLTEVQELELAASPRLLAVFYLLTRNWEFRDVVKRLDSSVAEITKFMIRLDKLGLISLLPKNRYRLLVRADFRMRQGGPLQDLYWTQVRASFLNDDSEDETELFLIGEVSKESWDNLRRKMNQFSKEARALITADSLLPKDHTESVGLFFLAKPWIFRPMFSKSGRK